MSATTRWWWVRHAPVVDQGGRIYGQRDVACDTSDGAAFRALAAALPETDVWVTSHLRRTTDTVAAIAACGLAAPEPRIERDLAEQSFGDWQGKKWNQIEKEDQRAHQAFWSDPTRNAPPGGESFVELIGRAAAVIRRLTAEHAGADIVAVTHGGTIRAAVAEALGLDSGQAMAVRIDNLSLTRLDHIEGGILRGHGGVWRVVGINVPPR